MRKFLLTTVGVAALTFSANATDFTLSGSAKVQLDDDSDVNTDFDVDIGVSKTFDNGMVLTGTAEDLTVGAGTEISIANDTITLTFGDIDQNEKAPGLIGDAASSDIGGAGAGNASDDAGAISLGVTLAGLSVGAATNNAGDTMFGASMTTDMSGIAVTVGADVYNDNITADDQTSMGISAGLGALTVNANSTQNSGNTEDRVSYGATYTIGGLVLGFQGNDNDDSSYAATYTVVPGMQFEIGSNDNGTDTTSSAELQMTF